MHACSALYNDALCDVRYYYQSNNNWNQCEWNGAQKKCTDGGYTCSPGDCECEKKCQSHVLPEECKNFQWPKSCETCAHRNI